ncbi:MAG: 5-oxoprolinase [Dehalococcoidales bacterium]|jgi:N-methylhydantoinase B|nr:5-oxoprolinase [Dehalococcoidales bacterium]MDP6577126.1 hydantoinase B/oxoprolinase family protein [Dehalococcoidales bacterium]
MERQAMKNDPIVLATASEGTIQIAREMRANTIRCAHSYSIAVMEDFSCGLFAANGELLAQGEDHPGHVIPSQWSIQCSLEDLGIPQPGDLILHNDSYRGGAHLNDVLMFLPVYRNSKLICYTAIRAHWPDVGGAFAGSMSGRSTSIYQDGIRIPAIKIQEGGKINKAALDLLCANMRNPDVVRGDFYAFIAGCERGRARVLELADKFGVEVLKNCIDEILNLGEERMRLKIETLPQGEYYYEDYLEHLYQGGELDPVVMRLKLSIKSREILADFTGSSPQVHDAVNSGDAVTLGGVLIAFKSILDPAAPINGGNFRPIKMIAPERTIVNAKPDVSTASHGETRKRAIAVVMGALSQAIPDLVCGVSHGCSWGHMIGFPISPETGRAPFYLDNPGGGCPALKDLDGATATGDIDFGAAIRVTLPVSVLEAESPVFIEKVDIVSDSGGPGRTRGGLGSMRYVRLLQDGTYSSMGDRGLIPPWGVAGGYWGYPVKTMYVRKGETRVRDFDTPARVTGFSVRKGDLLMITHGGGGGYGDPIERDPEYVKVDVEDGYVSKEQALEYYGVVLRDDLSISKEGTDKRRREIIEERVWLKVIHSDEYPYEGMEGEHRVCRLAPETAKRLQAADRDLLEMLGKHICPLRAWLIIDPGLKQGEVPLDKIGQSILGVKPEDKIWVRRITATSRFYTRNTEAHIFPVRSISK